jgi:secondary thiamine-phosphate synthase enzyme
MKSHREVLTFTTPARRAFINITDRVEEALAASGILEGLCLVNAMHITARRVHLRDSTRPRAWRRASRARRPTAGRLDRLSREANTAMRRPPPAPEGTGLAGRLTLSSRSSDGSSIGLRSLPRHASRRASVAAWSYPEIDSQVFINDDEPGLHQDYEQWLEKLAPHEPVSAYRHNRTGEDNGDAHLKRQVMGREVVVAVTGGRLDFGPWEQIFYGEFDGRRAKRVLIKIIGE